MGFSKACSCLSCSPCTGEPASSVHVTTPLCWVQMKAGTSAGTAAALVRRGVGGLIWKPGPRAPVTLGTCTETII